MTDGGLPRPGVQRRRVLGGGLVAGFTMATERAAPAQVIHTDEAGLDAGAVEVPTS